MCEKDLSQLTGLGGSFSPLGILNKLCIVHLNFDCNLSHEVRCGIFHLCHQVGAQKVAHLELFRFQVFGLGMLNLTKGEQLWSAAVAAHLPTCRLDGVRWRPPQCVSYTARY